MAQERQGQKGRNADPRRGGAAQHPDRRISVGRRAHRGTDTRPSPRIIRARGRWPKGETRERDPDLDPQIIWNGARIRLSKEQVRQLAETGEVEIGDAQLVWRGKDRQDWSDLVVQTPPLYIQEKIHPKAIIDDLKRRTKAAPRRIDAPDLFADFNGLDDPEARTEFYQHDQHWSNRMILGDSLQVMASLAEREALAGKVQCIYFDPPYGIKFNSNWQVSTLSRDVKDGKQQDVSPRAGAGQGVPRHLEGRHSLLPDLSARPADRGAGTADRERIDLRADRR